MECTGPQQNVDDDYCACRVKAVGGIHIIGAPHFFLNRGPARSKSGPGSFVRPSVHSSSVVCSFIHAFVHIFIHSFVHSFFICFKDQIICSHPTSIPPLQRVRILLLVLTLIWIAELTSRRRPALKKLHWLPIRHRITFKIAIFVVSPT